MVTVSGEKRDISAKLGAPVHLIQARVEELDLFNTAPGCYIVPEFPSFRVVSGVKLCYNDQTLEDGRTLLVLSTG